MDGGKKTRTEREREKEREREREGSRVFTSLSTKTDNRRMTTPPPTSNFFVCNDTGLHLHWDNQSKDYIIQQGKVGACVFKADIASKIVSDLNARYPDDTWHKVRVCSFLVNSYTLTPRTYTTLFWIGLCRH